MQLTGIHHVTAVTAKISNNVDFYTNVLGLRLVKKSVNQDDVSAYHLFYADRLGSPGSDMTFFDWAHIGPNIDGTDKIAGTAFRVQSREALEFWAERLTSMGAQDTQFAEFAGRDLLAFKDPEGQTLYLVNDDGADFDGEIWEREDIPSGYELRGFYSVVLSIPEFGELAPILTDALNFQEVERTTWIDGKSSAVLYRTISDGGPGSEVWLVEQPTLPRARLGAGGVHHVAFRVPNDEMQEKWQQHLKRSGLYVTKIIDRFWFHSIYFRVTNGILFEIATDGPGFTVDEDLEVLGEKLVLPPFLEPRRGEIEAGLKPIGEPVKT